MIYNGEVDVATAGTRVPLSSTRTPFSWIIIQSKITNTQFVYVGGNTVSAANGTALVAMDSVLFPPVSDVLGYDLAETYVDSDIDGEGVKFTYFRR